MKYGRYGWSHLFLSWGLGAVFLWVGLDILQHPQTWLGFVPPNVLGGLTHETTLQISGIVDVALGIAIILRWWQKPAALLAAIHLVAIVAFNGIDAVLIRDVGLLGAALALLTWPTKYRRKQWWKFWGRKKHAPVEEGV